MNADQEMSKEQVYDEMIAPLMDQILRVCKGHKIAMIASFAIPTEADPGLHCTSALLGSDHQPSPQQLRAYDAIFGKVRLAPC